MGTTTCLATSYSAMAAQRCAAYPEAAKLPGTEFERHFLNECRKDFRHLSLSMLDRNYYLSCMYGVLVYCRVYVRAQADEKRPVFCPSKMVAYTWHKWDEFDHQGMQDFLRCHYHNDQESDWKVRVPQLDESQLNDDVAALHTFALAGIEEQKWSYQNGVFPFLFTADVWLKYPQGYLYESDSTAGSRYLLSLTGERQPGIKAQHRYRYIHRESLAKAGYLGSKNDLLAKFNTDRVKSMLEPKTL